MKLYELSGQFSELFDRFDEINEYTPDDGVDPEALREAVGEAIVFAVVGSQNADLKGNI